MKSRGDQLLLQFHCRPCRNRKLPDAKSCWMGVGLPTRRIIRQTPRGEGEAWNCLKASAADEMLHEGVGAGGGIMMTLEVVDNMYAT